MATTAPHRPGPFADKLPGPVEAGERDAHHDNQPPLEERIMMEFLEELQTPGESGKTLLGRIEELLASAGRAPEKCESESVAGAMGDLCRQARDVGKRIEEIRERHNRPLLNAQRTLKGRADSVLAPLDEAIAKIRRRLDDWAAAEARRVAEEMRKEEEARRVAEDAARAAIKEQGLEEQIPEDQPIFATPAPKPAAPIARGDLGSSVGGRKVWKHEIESVRQLPDRILKHPKVVEALDKLIAAEIKAASGKIEIKGVKIWSETAAVVR
jgi:hypothetical protein